jgi:hypothetical protein
MPPEPSAFQQYLFINKDPHCALPDARSIVLLQRRTVSYVSG